MARKRGGLRISVYQGANRWSILFYNVNSILSVDVRDIYGGISSAPIT
jgi:hypothetical protein